MARVAEIGWGTEAKLLHEILKAIERLQKITAGVRGKESEQSGIEEDYYNPTFFSTGRTYLNLNVTNSGTGAVTFSVGTTSSGAELLSDEVVAPGEMGSFPINQVFATTTPIYVWSLDWNGAIIKIQSVSLNN